MGLPSGATKPAPKVDASDRKFYIRAAENGNKDALKDFDAALSTQQKSTPPKPPTPTTSSSSSGGSSATAPREHVSAERAADPSDQKFYNMAADRQNTIVDLKNRSDELRQNIDALGTSGGYVTGAMREELGEVEQEIDSYELQDLRSKAAGLNHNLANLPTDSFSGYARQGLQTELEAVEQQITDIEIRGLENESAEINKQLLNLRTDSFSGYARQGLEARLNDIEAKLAEYRGPSETMNFAEFKQATGEVFNQHVEGLMAEEGHDRAVAERLVSLQFDASGVPSEAMPDNVAGFDPFQVFQNQADAFDTAKEIVEGDRGNPDQFTSLDDLDAIINNPERFDPDVVTTAVLLKRAADQPGNEEFRAQFEKKSLWEQVKESPWLDPNSDSLMVNLVRGGSSGVVSPAFIQRTIDEGPGVLRQIDNSLTQLSPTHQAQLLVTDPGQLIDNYKSFGSGLMDWGVDTAKLGVGVAALATPGGAELLKATTGVDVRQEALDAAVGAGDVLINDPDELLQAVVGWDQFVDDPWRWAGNQAPDIILEILGTKGASKIVRGVDAAADVAEAGRVAGRLDDVPGVDVDLARLDDVPSSPDVDGLGVPGAVIPDSMITRNVGGNEISWRLDGDGRPLEVSAEIREVFSGATRSSDELAAQRNLPGKIEGDHAGHVIGHRFGLDQGMKNLFPQNGNFNTSAYKKLENEMADFVGAGAEVRVDVQVDWGPNGRPDMVSVQYDAVDPSTGRTVFSRDVEFDNIPGQPFDRVSNDDIVASLNGDGG